MSTTPKVETRGFWYKRCIVRDRLDGKIAIVTGANTGLGLAVTAELARRGALVIMACRSLERAERGKNKMLELYGVENPSSLTQDIADAATSKWITPNNKDQLHIEQLDLASLESVRGFVKRVTETYDHLHYLINNAGLVSQYATTEAGHEMTMAVNHLGHFLLTELLIPILRKAAPSRIVVIGSRVHKFTDLCKPDLHMPEANFSVFRAYCHSKLANSMYARELSYRLKGSGVLCVSVCPGPVNTELARQMTGITASLGRLLMQYTFPSPWQGAQTVLFAVFAPDLEEGGFYFNCATSRVHRAVDDASEREWLWKRSCELVGLETCEERVSDQ